MPAASQITTLIVDDQLTMRSLIRAALQQIGVTDIREAPDGERSRLGRAIISVPELVAASSIPRLVQESAHHL